LPTEANGPVIGAINPILTGSDWARAGPIARPKGPIALATREPPTMMPRMTWRRFMLPPPLDSKAGAGAATAGRRRARRW
jgi:hypothetical protein